MYTYMWTVTYLEKEAGVSKHSWKKIMQLLWADVTYLLINVKHRINMILIVLIETLDIPQNYSRFDEYLAI